MTAHDFLMLVRLLLKWRSSYAMSHRFRDVIDEVCLDCMKRADEMMHGNNRIGDDDIPF